MIRWKDPKLNQLNFFKHSKCSISLFYCAHKKFLINFTAISRSYVFLKYMKRKWHVAIISYLAVLARQILIFGRSTCGHCFCAVVGGFTYLAISSLPVPSRQYRPLSGILVNFYHLLVLHVSQLPANCAIRSAVQIFRCAKFAFAVYPNRCRSFEMTLQKILSSLLNDVDSPVKWRN